MRTFLIALLALVAPLAVAPNAEAAPNAVACTGYPQPRTYVSTQSWWTDDPARGLTGTDHGHLHLEGCIPERQTISTPQTIDLRVIMHENPGAVTYVSMVVKGTDYEKTVQKISINGLTCPSGTCEKWVRFTLDPASFSHSGLQEVRFRAFVPEPPAAGAAREMRGNWNWQVKVQNGKSAKDVSRYAFLRAKGWYTHALYCEAAFLSVPLPSSPVKGTINFRVQAVDHDGGTAGDQPVTRHTVSLDADAHAGIPGTVLRQGSGNLPATSFTVDTTKLSNGRHRIGVRADCDDRTLGSVNSGVAVLFFNVAN